jgi:hypothetical protein
VSAIQYPTIGFELLGGSSGNRAWCFEFSCGVCKIPLKAKRRRMTIAVGMIGSDGIVIAADQCRVCDDVTIPCQIVTAATTHPKTPKQVLKILTLRFHVPECPHNKEIWAQHQTRNPQVIQPRPAKLPAGFIGSKRVAVACGFILISAHPATTRLTTMIAASNDPITE